eukprot:gene16424-22638_t
MSTYVPHDVLYIGVGITPGKEAVPGAAQCTTGVKPIDKSLDRYRVPWSHQQASKGPKSPDSRMRVVVVGGGAGGVEVALSLQHQLEEERERMGGGEDCKANIT